MSGKLKLPIYVGFTVEYHGETRGVKEVVVDDEQCDFAWLSVQATTGSSGVPHDPATQSRLTLGWNDPGH